MPNKPDHIKPQTFRSVREAGYAEEDVDLYVKEITASYNRLMDAHYNVSVELENTLEVVKEKEAHIVKVEGELADTKTVLSETETVLEKTREDLNNTQHIVNVKTNEVEALQENVNILREQLETVMAEKGEEYVAPVVEIPVVETVPVLPPAVVPQVDSNIEITVSEIEKLLKNAEEIAKNHIDKANNIAEEKIAEAEKKVEEIDNMVAEKHEEAENKILVAIGEAKDILAAAKDRYDVRVNEAEEEYSRIISEAEEAAEKLGSVKEAELAWLLEKVDELVTEKDNTLSRLKDYYEYNLEVLTNMMGEYTMPDFSYLTKETETVVDIPAVEEPVVAVEESEKPIIVPVIETVETAPVKEGQYLTRRERRNAETKNKRKRK
jgi:ElaB/YqjD/DUF883 family membrane-anchored ribosome-binding protein